MRHTAFVLSLLLLGGAASAQRADLVGVTFDARVTRIIDGDTIDLLRNGERQPVRVRLEGIDAPELGEPYSTQARTFVRVLLFDQHVRVEGRDVDRYGRLLARVSAAGKDASRELLLAGLACHYTVFSSDTGLAAAERQARADAVGFWGVGAPRPRCATRPDGRGPAPRAEPRAPPAPDASEGVRYRGNTRSRVYHAPGCPNYTCPNCTAIFASQAAAQAAGFRPAGDCLRR